MRHRRGSGYSKFKTIEHPVTKRTADIKVDKRHGFFRCEIGEASKESQTLSVVESWAMALIAKAEKRVLDWKPVIRAHVEAADRFGYRRDTGRPENDGRGAQVKIVAERFYIALAEKDGDDREWWRELQWKQGDPESSGSLAPEDRWAMSQEFRKPSESMYSGETHKSRKGWVRLPEVSDGSYLIAYTPEVWAGLQHVIDVIEKESDIVKALLTTSKGLAKLAAIGEGTQQLQLTSGETRKAV